MASEVERAWFAGIIDGDGCITMNSPGSSAAAANKQRRPLVVIDSTDMEILEEVQRLYGGSLVRKPKAREHHRQAWSWRLYGADLILALLREVLPFMHCTSKRGRAQMLVDEYKTVTPRNGYYTPDLRSRRLDFERRFMAVGAGRGSQLFRATRKVDESNAQV